jgi:hypothetical protein
MTRPDHGSLPLFDEPPPSGRLGRNPHLDAAQRLARRIARLPEGSPAQVQAGQQLCRQLLAMLRAAEPDSAGRVPRH